MITPTTEDIQYQELKDKKEQFMNKHSKSKIRDADRIRSLRHEDLTVLDLDLEGGPEMMITQGIDPKQGTTFTMSELYTKSTILVEVF